MLNKDELYMLVHIDGTQVGARWPAVYNGEVIVDELEDITRIRRYQEFFYLQTLNENDARLARAKIQDGNFTYKNGEVKIKDCTRVLYNTAEMPYGGLSHEKHKSLLNKLVSVRNLIVNAVHEEAIA